MAKLLSVVEIYSCPTCKGVVARLRIDSPHLIRRRRRMMNRLAIDGYKFVAYRGTSGRKSTMAVCPSCHVRWINAPEG